MQLQPSDLKEITAKIIARSRAETCEVTVSGETSRNLRFANSEPTTNAATSSVNIAITSSYGQRSGTATVNAIEGAALDEAQARSEEIARLAPENPEFMPPLGPQTYEKGLHRFDPGTAAIGADPLAKAVGAVLAQGQGREVVQSGYVEATHSYQALATSAGLFACDQGTAGELTTTARNAVRPWSGWAGASATRFGAIEGARLGARAVEKAAWLEKPADLDPGTYTVVLEPAAVADLVVSLISSMDARSADEGRSFLAKAGGGTKLGEKVLSEAVSIASDPDDAVAPDRLFSGEGVPKRRTIWFEGGVARSMSYSRFWGQKMGKEPVPHPQNFSMTGGAVSQNDMIKGVKRGILVTRLWYIRTVDPKTLLITGMTRDGNFLIENGKVTRPALNLRFNDSPLSALGKIEAMGPAERTIGSETYGSAVSAPPLLISGFTFSSKSSGI